MARGRGRSQRISRVCNCDSDQAEKLGEMDVSLCVGATEPGNVDVVRILAAQGNCSPESTIHFHQFLCLRPVLQGT